MMSVYLIGMLFPFDPSEKPLFCQQALRERPVLDRRMFKSVVRRGRCWYMFRRFAAQSQSRVARPTRGGTRDRGVLKKYVEGLRDEPVGLVTSP